MTMRMHGWLQDPSTLDCSRVYASGLLLWFLHPTLNNQLGTLQ